jgi:hypothetical protein
LVVDADPYPAEHAPSWPGGRGGPEECHGSRVVPITVDLAGAEAKGQPPSVTVKW